MPAATHGSGAARVSIGMLVAAFLFAAAIASGCNKEQDSVLFVGPAFDFVDVKVVPGHGFACGLEADGGVACWTHGGPFAPLPTPLESGFASLDGCGLKTDGTVTCPGEQVTPPEGTFTQVSAYCGLKTDGSIVCWKDEGEPPQNGSNTYISLDSTSDHSCAVQTDGTIVCWGRAAVGLPSPPEGTFTSVSVGRLYACGVRTDATVACWGKELWLKDTPPTMTFESVSAGSDLQACGLRTDGTVWCWGFEAKQWMIPSGTFTSISVSDFYACGVRTDRTIACWGHHSVTIGSRESYAMLEYRSDRAVPCGEKEDGTIVCWRD